MSQREYKKTCFVLQKKRCRKHEPFFAANRIHFVREDETKSEKKEEMVGHDVA